MELSAGQASALGGGGKRRGSGLAIIALSLTRDCKPARPKGATERPEDKRETPAAAWLAFAEFSPRVAGGPSGGSLNPGAD